MQSPKAFYKFSSAYFFFYFGLGGILPLISLYLESIGLNGVQIGTITAANAFIGIFAGPLWGYVSDRTHKHKAVLIGLLAALFAASFTLTLTENYLTLLILFIVYSFVLSPINPLMDGITLHSSMPYGKIRLWGSIGFAIAAFSTGLLADRTSLIVIFYILMMAVLITFLLIWKTSINITHSDPVNIGQLKLLLTNKKFIVFLIYAMLITSTIGGMNTFFGLYFKYIGGNVTMVGFAFLLFAISEAPFMHLISKYLETHTPYKLLLIVPVLGIIRWTFYGLTSSPILVLATFAIQGIFYAPMLICGAEYIRLELPANLRTTGFTLYTAIGFGLGGIFINFFSGYIYDHYPANMIFIFYGALCLVALLFAPYIYRTRSIK